MEKARLAEDLSFTDALTGLRNRRFIAQTTKGDVAASLRLHREAQERGGPPTNADLMFLLVDIADYAAYVAKESGRNRCVGLSGAPEGLPPEAPVRATLEEWTREGRLCLEAAPA